VSDTSTKRSKKPTDMGKNRTGIATSPADAKQTIEGAIAGSPEPMDEPPAYAATKLEYSAEAGPYGSMPPPATLKGVAKAAVDLVKGDRSTVLIDKIAERLAFERGGTRLYEALLVKLDAGTPHEGGPTRDELEEIRDDEQRHFGILVKALRQLGADPTAMTPGANLVGVMTMGLVQVLNDPRTTLTQALEAAHVAELTDNDCWDALIELAAEMGKNDLAAMFTEARDEEREHLLKVRTWISNAVRGQAGIAEADRPALSDEAGASAPP
jgi:rubrerythrin